MCGIAGQFAISGEARLDVLSPMIAALRHRGPDDTGIHQDRSAGLAHARLSIIDVACGQQPMSNDDGTLWISFNGEIFNYLELRTDLEKKGHRFRTASDTEVLLRLFESLGEECVHLLNGQWAFAIWDTRRNSMFLSRDRLGVRPLFYTQTRGVFLFASEMKALFTHPEVPRELDLTTLNQIFTFWTALAPATAFRNIQELPPGHSMRVDRSGVRVWRYWQMNYPEPVQQEERELAGELLALLTDATRLRVRSDVPYGAYLSGGLDSSLIAALIQRVSPRRLRTFSIGFDDAAYDESEYQQECSRFLGTEHESVVCSAHDIQQVFPQVVHHAETPLLRTAPAPMFLLAEQVRRSGFKVVLTGEGADEMFGGYDIFKEAKVRRFWAAQPHSRLRPLLLRKLYPYLAGVQAQPDAYLRSFFHIEDRGPFFSHQPRWELTSRLKVFLSPAVRQTAGMSGQMEASLPAEFHHWDAFSQAQYLETAHLLPGYILSSQGDRMAMAHSVEARHPFLDLRVVAFASHLPARLKMKVLNEKYLLKRSAQGLIPASILQRKKQPYRAPEGSCFFGSKPAEYVGELLSPSRIRRNGIFDAKPVERLVQKFKNGTAQSARDNMALTGILSTQILLNRD